MTKQETRLLRVMSEAIEALKQVADDACATPGETHIMRAAEGMAAEMRDLRHDLRQELEERSVALSMFSATPAPDEARRAEIRKGVGDE